MCVYWKVAIGQHAKPVRKQCTQNEARAVINVSCFLADLQSFGNLAARRSRRLQVHGGDGGVVLVTVDVTRPKRDLGVERGRHVRVESAARRRRENGISDGELDAGVERSRTTVVDRSPRRRDGRCRRRRRRTDGRRPPVDEHETAAGRRPSESRLSPRSEII